MNRIKTIGTGLALLLAAVAQAQAVSWSQRAAAAIMQLGSNSFSAGDQPVGWSAGQGLVLKAMEGVWYQTGNGKYYQYLEKSLEPLVGKEGALAGYQPADYHLDNLLPGRTLLTLYNVSGKEKYYQAATRLRQQLRIQPRNTAGCFWYQNRYPSQVWLNGLYMAGPFYAEYARLFHEDSAFADITRQLLLVEQHARDASSGLLFHGWDESKQQRWANPATGTSPACWARGMGWYGMALVDVLEQLPLHYPRRDALLQALARYANAVKKVQDPSTGLWRNVLNAPAGKHNYPEAAANALFVYVFAKAVRLGYLPESNLALARKGYAGLLRQLVQTDADGRLNLKGTAVDSGQGSDLYRDGSIACYLAQPVVANDPVGLGAFLLASNEMEWWQQPKTGKGKTVLLDSYFNNEERKDVTGAIQSFHYKWEEMDNNGFSIWGYAFRAAGASLQTLYEAPAPANLEGKAVYLIVDPDTKAETPQPHYMDSTSAQHVYNWVHAGGVLVLMMNDSANTEFAHFNLLAEKFGMHFNRDFRHPVTGNQYEMGAAHLPAGDRIFTTARKVYLKEVCTIGIQPPARAHYQEGASVLMAVARVGKGTVFAVTDPWLYNEYTDGRKLPPGFDNYLAAKDLVNWLLQQAGR